jgi:hypothetical protein
MRKAGTKKVAAIRRQAYQIALQLPDGLEDAELVLESARALHRWIMGAGSLPDERVRR